MVTGLTISFPQHSYLLRAVTVTSHSTTRKGRGTGGGGAGGGGQGEGERGGGEEEADGEGGEKKLEDSKAKINSPDIATALRHVCSA